MLLLDLELVVGGAGDDLELEAGQGVVGHDLAERARGEDVRLHVVDRIGRDRLGVKLVHRPAHPLLVDIGDEELDAFRVEVLGEEVAGLAEALDGHLEPRKVVGAVHPLGARLDPVVHAPRGHRRGVAASAQRAGDAGDVGRLMPHPLHVGHARPHVLRGDVATTQAVHEAAEGAEERLALLGPGIPDDDRLAAAQVQPRRRRLVGHAAGEPEHVFERLRLVGEGPHAATTQRGAEHGVVDRDDGLESGGLVGTEHHLLVVPLTHQFEHAGGHRSLLLQGEVQGAVGTGGGGSTGVSALKRRG